MSATLLSFVPSLGWALVHFVWQGSLVGIAAAIALILLRDARPQVRYAVCCTALALCLALPVLGVWKSMRADASIQATPSAAVEAASSREPGDRDLATIAALATLTPGATSAWKSSLQERLPWIVALWSLGAGLLAARMAIGMMWVGRIGRLQSQPSHPRWQRRLDRLAEKMGIERAVRLRVMDGLASPVAAGCWKPIVLVPAALIANMPLDLLEALLAHELAHIRRHDYLVNLIQSAIESLLFYHPVVWWLSQRIRIEREQIADDLAAQALGEPRRLALALHELDEFQRQLQAPDHFPDAFHLVPAANGGHLMSRIHRLIRPNQHALSWKMALPIIGLTAVCLTVYAHDATSAAAPAASGSSAVATPHAAAAPAISVTGAAPVARPVYADGYVAAAATATATATSSISLKQLANLSSIHGHEDAYALVRADREGISMSGDTRDIPAIERARKKVHGDFIWTRHDGKTYVVQDPTLVAKATAAWAPAEAVDKQMEALEAQMKVPEQKMEALSQQMEKLSDAKSPVNAAMETYDAQMEALGRQQEALGTQMEKLGDQIGDANDHQREALQQKMDTLQARMEPLSAQMKKLSAEMERQAKQIEADQQPMEALGKQMEAESKPMEALGKQMEALGKQEEAISRDADRTIRALVDEAIRAGKAEPTGEVRQE